MSLPSAPRSAPLLITSDAWDFPEQNPWEQEPSAEEQAWFERMHDGLLRRQGSLRGQQEQLWACIQAMRSLTAAVVQRLASEPPSLERRWQLNQLLERSGSRDD